ncbi:amino acid permease-associated region [Richelia intracellularis HM01]|nr:amino acid permease-associated region [Richelia intracellularis HM01]
MLTELRISAIPSVIVANNRTFERILSDSSSDADIIFLGMAASTGKNFIEYYEQIHARTSGLPTIIYVMAAADFAFGSVLTGGGI